MAKPTIFTPGFPASELHDKNTGEKLFPPALGNIDAALQKLIQVPGDVVAGPPILYKIKRFAPAAASPRRTATSLRLGGIGGSAWPRTTPSRASRRPSTISRRRGRSSPS